MTPEDLLRANALTDSMIKGIGPSEPKVTNELGGQQSRLPYRFDLLDSHAMFALAEVLYYGVDIRGYPENNWRSISAESNVNHAMAHIFAWLNGDKQDKHLEHAFCRLMFALGVELQGGPQRASTDSQREAFSETSDETLS